MAALLETGTAKRGKECEKILSHLNHGRKIQSIECWPYWRHWNVSYRRRTMPRMGHLGNMGGQMKPRTDYPLHGCTVCNEPTTMRNYCVKHHKLATKIGYTPASDTWMDGDIKPSPLYRRHSNNDTLRG